MLFKINFIEFIILNLTEKSFWIKFTLKLSRQSNLLRIFLFY